MSSIDNLFLSEAVADGWQQPFRGPIWEYARKLDLQAGYAVKGAFQIETARWLIEPFEAIRDPRVRLISIRGAVQTLKSLCPDIVVPYWIEHDPGDTLWLFEDDAKARLYAETRAMPLIHSVPEITALLTGVDRHDKTKTKIKFRHMNLVFAGLNLGNVQSLSYQKVIIDEAWLHPFDGLIRQAKERTRQYPHTSKIIILGQGGVEDDDADTEHKKTDCRELHWLCPHCGFPQPFDLSRKRPDDFHVEQLRGSYSGLSWDTNETTRPGGNRWNYEEVGKTGHYRCHRCDHRIDDTPDNRRKLMDSYHFVRTNPNAPVEAVGFHWPAEVSPRIPFAELVVKYLRAKTVAEEQGYRLPLKEYYQKDRGLSWTDAAEAEYRSTVQERYEPNAAWPEEAYRALFVDCQRDLSKFFYSAFAVALSGEARELRRGRLDSFASIAALQAELKIKDQHVYLDCGYRMTDVLRECVKHGHVGSVKVGKEVRKIWLCWTGMKGSGQEFFYHIHPKTLIKEARIYSPRKFYDTNVGTAQRSPRAPWYEWSNLHCKDLLRSRRDADPGAPKFLTLPDDLPPTDQASYFAQMRSEKRVEQYRNGKKIAIWLPIKESRPNHFWDCASMLIAFMGICGIIGAPEVDSGGIAENADRLLPQSSGH